MASPETVTAYRTSDGALFSSLEQANLHQAKLDFGLWYAANALDGNYAGSKVSTETLFAWLFEHRDRVAELLGFVEVAALSGADLGP